MCLISKMEVGVGSKVFEDEHGGIWIVTKTGSNLEVKGRRETRVSLHKIARSCATKLGVSETNAGVPIEYINEHRRIWNAIWQKGREA
jgi:hypothetical protein